MGYKVLSDATLMRMTKKDIIQHLRTAEHNRDVANEFCEQQFQNMKDWRPTNYGTENAGQKEFACLKRVRETLGFDAPPVTVHESDFSVHSKLIIDSSQKAYKMLIQYKMHVFSLWNPINDEDDLPERPGEYIFSINTGGGRRTAIAWYGGGKITTGSGLDITERATAWMPMPDPFIEPEGRIADG